MKTMNLKPILLDSITDVSPIDPGRIAICGSHGGLYPAAIASGAGLRAVIFNDAGIGLENAGIGGLIALESVGMAGVAVQAMSARIGSASDTEANGVVSFVNSVAKNLGVSIGMNVPEAASLLANASTPTRQLEQPTEASSKQRAENGSWIHLLDSASMVNETHIGSIVITGSHGALIGGNPKRALKVAARVAVFNDAGFGPDDVGISRLPALEAQNISAVCVAAHTARIGDAASALETGIISAANKTALALGAAIDMPLADWLDELPA